MSAIYDTFELFWNLGGNNWQWHTVLVVIICSLINKIRLEMIEDENAELLNKKLKSERRN